MRVRGLVVGVASAVLLAAAPASAEPLGLASCRTMLGGTAGVPEAALAPLRSLPGPAAAKPAPAGLPATVALRAGATTFNRRWWFALRDGRVYLRANRERTGRNEPWRALELPRCLEGRAAAVSSDDDELVVTDSDGLIHTMDGALGEPGGFNWTVRWGPPLWAGTGHTLPGDTVAWAFSDLSNTEDVTWADRAGNANRVGGGKVTSIYALRGDRRRIALLDPWLANDYSYEVCGPQDGRLRIAALSASASVLFVADRYGHLYSRTYDFDISGGDPVFFVYSYEDQRGRVSPAIQLPAPGWVREPDVPGAVTDRISIHKLGGGSHRLVLRVEGRHGTATGYWEKPRGGGEWRFVASGEALGGTPLGDPAAPPDLGAPATRAYAGTGAGATLLVPDFDVACTPSTLRVELPGRTLTLSLHGVDGLRQLARGEGLDARPRTLYGAIEVPAGLTGDSWVKSILGGRRFTEVTLSATSGELLVEELGWTLRSDGGTGAASPPALDPGDLLGRLAREARNRGVPLPDFG